MSDVRIYKPRKSAMQSGLRGKNQWVFEFIQPAHLYIDPFMNWTGSFKMNGAKQKLLFSTLEKAISYAKSKNYNYTVEVSHPLKVSSKRYSDNFTHSKKS